MPVLAAFIVSKKVELLETVALVGLGFFQWYVA